ncbi:MAG: hypothetical protein IPN68_02975 [Bacteroidetes bacterium]|nr:hypothetical protein [Bacteroidota bacterium]
MKHYLLTIPLLIFLVSCEKSSDYLIPESEVPEWLKTSIAQDKKTLESDPRSSLNISAWIRTEYKGDYYFEFINLLSSAGPRTYKSDGTEFMYTDNGFMDYQSGKCCKKYVWKGPDYFGD